MGVTTWSRAATSALAGEHLTTSWDIQIAAIVTGSGRI
jgi:hypothetical protein